MKTLNLKDLPEWQIDRLAEATLRFVQRHEEQLRAKREKEEQRCSYKQPAL